VDHGVSRVTCHVQDLDAWADLLRAPTKLPSIDSRHDDIGQQKINLRLFLQEDGQSSLGAGSRNDAIIQVSQKFGNICTQVRIIFDDEYRLQFLVPWPTSL